MLASRSKRWARSTKADARAADAVARADLVYIALPVDADARIVCPQSRGRQARRAGHRCVQHQAVVCAGAASTSPANGSARFLGGHPMAGKEISGIDRRTPNLFRGAQYALITAQEDDSDPRVAAFCRIAARKLGAEPIWWTRRRTIGRRRSFRTCRNSLAVALAGVVHDETDETACRLRWPARGLRDALRLAGSPYAVWRDICLTNTDNLQRALDRMSRPSTSARRPAQPRAGRRICRRQRTLQNSAQLAVNC